MTAPAATALPSVTWNGHRITRLLIGHNPIKGGSHYSEELSAEMRAWYADPTRGLELLERCEACGIDTAQFGGENMHQLLSEHKKQGGRMQWIATLYCNEQGNLGFGDQVAFEEELQQILAVDPPPIGIQHFGESTDRLYFEGRLGDIRERLKRLRDTGLLIGLCTHLPEVVEEAASQDWDVDFYQTSVYTVYSGTRRKIAAGQRTVNRREEIFDDPDRERMMQVIQQLEKPCIAFKVLGSNRKCGTAAEVRAALRYAFDHIKETDIVCVGMWQKHQDQVTQNTDFVREILCPAD